MPNWNHVLREIQSERNDPNGLSAADKVRLKYLTQLHDHTKRNIICYYSGWLSKPRIEGSEINDEDKNGFMLCVHKLDPSKGLDLFLHTPGGSVAATASLVNYIRQIFGNDVRAVVPQIAMSAGTMLACSCKEIIMGKHSNLGPVDPQFNGIPAHAVIEELNTAYQQIIADPRRQAIWNPILSRYTPSFVQQCEWAIDGAKQFVRDFLLSNMFSQVAEPNRTQIVTKIVDTLSDLSKNKRHDKHIHLKECKDMGLVIGELEDPSDRKLQDLVLTVHHCFMFALSNSPAFKIIENHVGKRYVKLQQMIMIPNGTPGASPPGIAAPAAPPQQTP